MVGILLDKKFSNSIWCENFYSGLTQRLREKRISFCEIGDTCPADIETVFIIGSDIVWTTDAIKQLNAGGIEPILLCNQSENIPGCIYNCVCSDINASMRNLVKKIKSSGKKNIAFYAMNPSSIPDTSRADILMTFKSDDIEKITVFKNEGSLSNCYHEFATVANEYDAVICANDFAAISLVKNLESDNPQLLKKLSIISCSYSKLSEHYREHILSLQNNYVQFGRAAVYIYETIQKHNYLSGLVVKIAWNFEINKPQKTCDILHINPTDSFDTFYEDAELNEMLIVDKLLTLSDGTDKEILNALINNLSYEIIAEKCFLTANAVKYRIKKLISISGGKSREQIVSLLKKYAVNGLEK